MSNDQNEDDWESAEKRLKDLSIVRHSRVIITIIFLI